MAMTKESMADFIEGYLTAIPHTPVEGQGDPSAHRRAMLEAFCQGIIDEIVTNAEGVTTAGAPDGEHVVDITA